MDNKVGSNIPTPDEINQAIAALNTARTILQPYLITLSSEERRRLTRFRPGGDMVIEKVGSLASERNISLPGASVANMHNDLELARRLSPVTSVLEDLRLMVSDTTSEAQAECWWAATALYSTLARTQGADRPLEAALKPVVGFFATGPRKPRSAPQEQPK